MTSELDSEPVGPTAVISTSLRTRTTSRSARASANGSALGHAPGQISQYSAERIRRASKASGPEAALRLANELLGGYGVEYVCGAQDTSHVATGISYVNMGDTYQQTVIYDHATHRFYWHQSWGDFIERAPIGRF